MATAMSFLSVRQIRKAIAQDGVENGIARFVSDQGRALPLDGLAALYEHVREEHGLDAAIDLVVRMLLERPSVEALQFGFELAKSRKLVTVLNSRIDELVLSCSRHWRTGEALAERLQQQGRFELAQRVYALTLKAADADTEKVRYRLLRSLAALTPRPIEADTASIWSLADETPAKPARVKHRLVVFDEGVNEAYLNYVTFLSDKVTFFKFGDLYGNVDLARFTPSPARAEIEVEHARSRITRFSSLYRDLHAKTETIGQRATEAVLDSGVLDLVSEQGRHYAGTFKVTLADRMFFDMLHFDALDKIVHGAEFDEILVVFAGNYALYHGMFASLRRPPQAKVMMVGPAPDRSLREAFLARRDIAAALFAGDDLQLNFEKQLREQVDDPLPGFNGAGDSIRASVDRLLDNLPDRRGEERRLLFVTQENRAYLSDAASICAGLNRRYALTVLFAEGGERGPREFGEALAALGEGDPGPRVALYPPRVFRDKGVSNKLTPILTRRLAEPFLAILRDYAEDPVAYVSLTRVLPRLVGEDLPRLLAQILFAETLLRREGFEAVAVCPGRVSPAFIFADAARAVGVPSFTIESHSLNATYPRYTKIWTDFATVPSNYVAEEYVERFGSPPAQTLIVGSPRFTRTPGYDSAAARAAGRAALELAPDQPVIAFTTQPIDWDHMQAVWRMTARALRNLPEQTQLLLKTHREEKGPRIQRYLEIAAEEGAGDRVRHVEGDVKLVLQAADLLLTCYSVTALEGLIMERDVFIVSREGVEYPVSYEKLVGALTFRDADSLGAALRRFFSGEGQEESRRRLEAFRDDHRYFFDGEEVTRIADAIEAAMAAGRDVIRPLESFDKSVFVVNEGRDYVA